MAGSNLNVTPSLYVWNPESAVSLIVNKQRGFRHKLFAQLFLPAHLQVAPNFCPSKDKENRASEGRDGGRCKAYYEKEFERNEDPGESGLKLALLMQIIGAQ